MLLDHLFTGQEHVLQNLDQFCLQLSVRRRLPHLHDLDDRLLCSEDPELDDALVLLFSGLLRAELKSTDDVDLPPRHGLAVLDDGEVLVDPELRVLVELLGGMDLRQRREGASVVGRQMSM